MANTLNNNNLLDIHSDLPSLVNSIIRQRIFGQSSRRNTGRYSIRILLSKFAATGYYFEHVGSGGKTIAAYNKEEDINYTPLDKSPEIALHDRTKVVFPIDIDSEESVVPPNYDLDGNEIREEDWDHEKNSDSTGLVPPDYDSDGNEIL